MELSQLRYFITVSRLGNMSKAAETLFVSQPNLSTSISRLEEEVGVPLFERRRGRIALNQNGALLLKSVEQALSILDSGVQAVRDLHSGKAAPLSLACMVDDTDLLSAFVLANPDVNLVQQRADLPAITQMLDNCEVDLALTVLQPPSEEVVFERVYSCPFVLLMSRNHPLAAERTITRRQLVDQRLAIDGSRVNKATFLAAESSKFGFTPVIDYDVRHLDLLVSLVESRSCISIIPAVKYKELCLQGRLRGAVCRPYANGAPEAFWGIAYNERRPPSSQGLQFRDFVRTYFESVDRDYAAQIDAGVTP